MVTLQIMHDLAVRNSLVHELSDSSLKKPGKSLSFLRMVTNTDVSDQSVRTVVLHENYLLFHNIDVFLLWELSLIFSRPFGVRTNNFEGTSSVNNYSFPENKLFFLLDEAIEIRFSIFACETRGFFLQHNH